MRRHLALYQACSKCSKRNQGKRERDRRPGREKDADGEKGGVGSLEMEMTEIDGRRERERIGIPAGVGHCAGHDRCPPPNVHEATIAHKEMAAISLS